jgi:hypothetical protein
MRFNEFSLNEDLAVDARYATKAEMQHLANELMKQMPGYRFEVEKKAVSPVFYIRIKGAEKPAILAYFASLGLDPLPPEPEQLPISGQYRANILSFSTSSQALVDIPVNKQHKIPQEKQQAQEVIYTMVVAGTGGEDGSISVGKKELTPVELGLATRPYTKASLVTSAKAAVAVKTKTRPDLTEILNQLIDIAAAGGKGQLAPELNAKLGDKARNQISVDFGEILAPLMFAKGGEKIEFPAEGNYPLIDVIVGQNRYSVKSLTGSGTSFASISDLMDSYEDKIGKEKSEESEKVQALFQLFKGYHPAAGGKNVDKIIRGAAFVKVPEYVTLTDILGADFTNWSELSTLVENTFGTDNRKESYSKFLKKIYPAMVAGNWGKPTGLPADGNYYMGKAKELKAEKEAGYPSFKANPVKAMTDILTYAVGVGTLNLVTKGSDANQYAEMMTNIVNQSPAYLGRLDITSTGGVVASSKPFSELGFKFQYHAPSHIPGNNLPGFMIVY